MYNIEKKNIITKIISENKSDIIDKYNVTSIKVIDPAICRKFLFSEAINFLVNQNEKAKIMDIVDFQARIKELFNKEDINVEIHTEESLDFQVKNRQLSLNTFNKIIKDESLGGNLLVLELEKKSSPENKKMGNAHSSNSFIFSTTPVEQKILSPKLAH